MENSIANRNFHYYFGDTQSVDKAVKTLRLEEAQNKDWIDYTSLELLMRCPRMYWWRCVRHITPSVQPVALTNGRAYHEARALYKKSRMRGIPHKEAISLALALSDRVMSGITVEDPKRNITVARATLQNYFDRWRDDPSQTLAVEVAGALDFGKFAFIFKVDETYRDSWGFGIMETKVTSVVGKRWHRRVKPNTQLDGYMFGVSAITGDNYFNATLDIIPIHENPSKRKEPFRLKTSRTEKELNEWYENVCGWFECLELYQRKNFFPMNTERCVPLVGFECYYSVLCEKYPGACSLDEIQLPAEFKVERWAPFEFNQECSLCEHKGGEE